MASEKFAVLTLLFNSRRRLNNVFAGMVPSDKDFAKIKKAISDIDKQRDELTRIFVKDGTNRFVKANHDLVKVNDNLRDALADLANMQKTIDAVTAMIRSVDGFIAAVTPG